MPSIKQVLCQYLELLEKDSKIHLKTITCVVLVGMEGDEDMSTDCRQYRTSKRGDTHKLLIRKDCATVSEERQSGEV